MYDGECYCDYDPPAWITTREIKAARKPHRCDECGAHIAPGDPYEYVCGKWNGYVDRFHTCRLCRELRQWAMISVPCFCWAYGNLHDDVREMVREVAHKVPGMFFEYGRRMIQIKRAKAKGQPNVLKGRSSQIPATPY